MLKRSLLALVALAGLAGCVTAPPTSVGKYSDQPLERKVPGSNAQAKITRLLDFSKDEVFEAAAKAMLRLGYSAEDKNPQLGRITGNGNYQCGGGLMPPVTMALYANQLSDKPETQLTIIVDRHNFDCWGGGEMRAADQLATEVQKVLSTF
jgi:hypothetical protein